MQTVYTLISDSGDGTQHIEWYKGSEFSKDDLIEAASNDKYNSYSSGDGVQLSIIRFPDSLDLDAVEGINWCTKFPGVYDSD